MIFQTETTSREHRLGICISDVASAACANDSTHVWIKKINYESNVLGRKFHHLLTAL